MGEIRIMYERYRKIGEQYYVVKAKCQYCGKQFESSQSRHKHVHTIHEKEIKRY